MTQNWDKVHGPILFGLSSNMGGSSWCASQITTSQSVQMDSPSHQLNPLWSQWSINTLHMVAWCKRKSTWMPKLLTMPKPILCAKIKFCPKWQKCKIHSRLSLCPCLFQIDAKDLCKMVCGANRLRPQPHLSPMIQHQPCLEPHPFSEQSSIFSLQNHLHTFPINRWRFPPSFSKLESPPNLCFTFEPKLQEQRIMFWFSECFNTK